ncbi:hypothetical protein SAMN05216419_105018, partial [Nitrosomonas cryotolerans]
LIFFQDNTHKKCHLGIFSIVTVNLRSCAEVLIMRTDVLWRDLPPDYGGLEQYVPPFYPLARQGHLGKIIGRDFCKSPRQKFSAIDYKRLIF